MERFKCYISVSGRDISYMTKYLTEDEYNLLKEIERNIGSGYEDFCVIKLPDIIELFNNFINKHTSYDRQELPQLIYKFLNEEIKEEGHKVQLVEYLSTRLEKMLIQNK